MLHGQPLVGGVRYVQLLPAQHYEGGQWGVCQSPACFSVQLSPPHWQLTPHHGATTIHSSSSILPFTSSLPPKLHLSTYQSLLAIPPSLLQWRSSRSRATLPFPRDTPLAPPRAYLAPPLAPRCRIRTLPLPRHRRGGHG